MNEPPDDRALAAYEARTRHHESIIALVDLTLAGLRDHSDSATMVTRALSIRDEAQRGLRVMKALVAAWDRDSLERQAHRDQWESEIRARFTRFGR